MAKKEQTVQVRAKVAHLQPGTHAYRNPGDVFSHTGEVYEHVELVKTQPEAEPQGEDEGVEWSK